MGVLRVPASLAVVALFGAVVAGSCSSGTNGTASSPTTTSSTVAPPVSLIAPSTTAVASASWWTYFHDSSRTGVASDGPAAPDAVRRQWASPTLDGDLYAEPLIVGDKVIAASENDTVYALSVTTGAVVWSQHLGSPVASSSLPCGNINRVVGITSTPVVDGEAGRVYAAAMVQPGRHLLYALNLANGSVVASTAIDGPAADPLAHNQRGALALTNGHVIVPFGGNYGDCGTYHGVLASVPVTSAGLDAPTWYTLPSGNEGGFWASPGPVIAADGSIYVSGGNTASGGTYDYANSVLHLSAGLALVDSFAPANWAALNASDSDLGSTSPVLVGSNRVFQIGKAGIGYLLDAGHLGGVGGQLTSAQVCRGQVIGGVSHVGTTLFVPCPGGLAAVSTAGDRVAVQWTATVARPGPTIVTEGALWTVATASGELVALDRSSGKQLLSQSIGSVPSRFTTPAAAAARVVVAADRKVMAFAD